MTEILQMLRVEHRDFAKVLDVLEQESESCCSGGSFNDDIIRDVVDYCRAFPELCHHPKEDLLYRRLRTAAPASAIEALGDLIAEHEALSDLTGELEAAVDNLLSGAGQGRRRFPSVARRFLEQYRRHMKTEEETLFPLALKYLSAEDWQKVARSLEAFEESHPAHSVADRFAALSQTIVAHEELQSRLAERDQW